MWQEGTGEGRKRRGEGGFESGLDKCVAQDEKRTQLERRGQGEGRMLDV